jgi:hypothetical protein
LPVAIIAGRSWSKPGVAATLAPENGATNVMQPGELAPLPPPPVLPPAPTLVLVLDGAPPPWPPLLALLLVADAPPPAPTSSSLRAPQPSARPITSVAYAT